MKKPGRDGREFPGLHSIHYPGCQGRLLAFLPREHCIHIVPVRRAHLARCHDPRYGRRPDRTIPA